MEKEESVKKDIKEEKFTWNRKYLTICLYAVLVVLASALIIKAIMGWSTTMAYISGFFALISPFLWGGFIAFLLNPFVKMLDKNIFGRIKGVKKNVTLRKVFSLLLAYIFAIGVIILAVVYLVPQIGSSIAELINQIPKWIDNVNKWILEFEANHPEFDYVKINETINDYLPQLVEFSKNLLTNVLPIIYSTSVSLMRVIVNSLIAIMVSVYFIADKKILAKNFKKLLYAAAPEKSGDFVMKTLHECYHIFSQFVFGKAIDSLIIGCLCFVLMTIFQFPYALLISLIVGVTNMIPYFGPFIGAVPGVIFILMIDPLQALFFIVLIIVLQQFDGLFLGPRILGETVGLRPIWIIFAITVGGSLAGVVGMFLGVPVVAVIAYLMDNFLNMLIRKKNIDIEKKIG